MSRDVRRLHGIAVFIQTNQKKQMKTLKQLSLLLVAWAGLVGCTTTQPRNASAGMGVVLSPQDEAAVRATVAEFVNTWNHHDMKGPSGLSSAMARAMCELVTEDVLWINFIGNIWRGNEVCGFHDLLHRTQSPQRSLSIEKMEVRSLAPQVAVATVRMKFGKA